MPKYFISYDFSVRKDDDFKTGSGCTIVKTKYKIRDMDDIRLITKEIQEREPLLYDASIAIQCIQKL